jgi:hypothetical protein
VSALKRWIASQLLAKIASQHNSGEKGGMENARQAEIALYTQAQMAFDSPSFSNASADQQLQA